jgi:hypothetical protein
MERYLCKAKCAICHKPVYADQGYYSVSMDHYDCVLGERKQLKDAIKKVDKALDDLGIKPKRTRVRDGKGRIAQKVIKLATEAFERETGCTVTNTLIWNQPICYRGPKYDLAAWGIDFEFVLKSGLKGRGSISSWCTMTQAAKSDVMELSPTNIPYQFEN